MRTRETPDSWIPARWPGGPLELYQRAKAKTPPADATVREAIANWYDPATLHLLEGSPVNCLLLTWSAGADAELERQQQQLVKTYTTEAHRRGVAILPFKQQSAPQIRNRRGCKLFRSNWTRHVIRARLAERRYESADPENRLVIGELETRWNAALRQVAESGGRFPHRGKCGPCDTNPGPIFTDAPYG